MIVDLINNIITQDELLYNYNANVSLKKLPHKVLGFVFNYKGINNIIINDNLPYYKKKKTILHELAHIELNQLGQYDNDLFAFRIDEYEDEADRYIESMR